MQLALITKTWSKDRFAFGGALLKNSHAKVKRHFRPALPLHVVLRSSQATGNHSLLRRNDSIARALELQAQRHSIRVHAAANAGNHLHLLIRAPSREHLANFLRGLSGRIAQIVGGNAKRPTRFWDARPFSRIVSWGQDFARVARYIGMNSTEMAGFSRTSARAMFAAIHEALRAGRLARTPSLVAAGFG